MPEVLSWQGLVWPGSALSCELSLKDACGQAVLPGALGKFSGVQMLCLSAPTDSRPSIPPVNPSLAHPEQRRPEWRTINSDVITNHKRTTDNFFRSLPWIHVGEPLGEPPPQITSQSVLKAA